MDNRETKNKDRGVFACVDSTYLQTGLSKREYFAGLAMQAFISNHKNGINFKHLSEASIQASDALLEQLEKKQ
jgi:hypothetical protein